MRGKKKTANAVQKEAESQQMAYWWARKEAEREAGAVLHWDEDAGSRGTGAFVNIDGDQGRRSCGSRDDWRVVGELVHHSVDTRGAWWGEELQAVGEEGAVSLDLRRGRAASSAAEADLSSRRRKARRKE